MPDDSTPKDAPTADAEDQSAGQASDPEVLAAGDEPGDWTALAAPGKPDGEVDTRS
jgi:hypothetical protein